MRDAWPDRGPKAVDATGVDDVALLGVLQPRQKRAGAVIDAAPADVERALPFVADIGNHAAAAADTGVVEQSSGSCRSGDGRQPRRETARPASGWRHRRCAS